MRKANLKRHALGLLAAAGGPLPTPELVPEGSTLTNTGISLRSANLDGLCRMAGRSGKAGLWVITDRGRAWVQGQK